MQRTAQIHSEARRGAKTLVALGALVAGLLVIIAGAIKFAADRSDQDAIGRAAALATHGLSLEREAILRELKTFAVWDETVNRTAIEIDTAFVHSTFGQAMYDDFHHDRSFVLSTDDRPIYASTNGEIATPKYFERMRADVTPLLAKVRADWRVKFANGALVQPAAHAGYLDVEGRPALLAIATIISDTGRLTMAAEETSLAISIKFLDGSFGAKFAQTYLLRDFAVAPGSAPAGIAPMVTVPTDSGFAPYHVSWTAERPGTRMLEQVVPVLLGGLLTIGAIAGALVAMARRANGRLAASEHRANTLAYRDTLTGRANRAFFVETLTRVMAEPGALHVGVIYADLDGFKDVNDTLGHSAGDELLRLVADRLASAVRARGDVVARFGGDEFAIMIADLTSPDEIAGVCRRLAAVFHRPFVLSDHSISVDVALGAAVAPDHGSAPVDLMRRADIALHEAKKMGRGAWLVFERAYEDQMVQRRTIDQELRLAIDNDELDVHFQPQYSVDGERLVGFEALARWHHPTRGMIPPGEFIQIAEETGLILRLDEWILRRALRDGAPWGDLTIAVNLSPLHFRTEGTLERVRRILAQTGFPARRLELELTETVLIDNSEAFAVLESLRADGIQLALDDFGSGYSSLNYVRRFVFDKLKIDKSFVQSIGITQEATAIVECVVRLGRALGQTVLAEGVESAEQQRYLRACGCHLIQGYHLGRPMPVAEARALVAARLHPDRPKLRVVEA